MLVRVSGERGQVLQRVPEARACCHDADEEGGPVARELAHHDEAHAEEVVAEDVNACRKGGRGLELELPKHRCGDLGGEDPEEGLHHRFLR